MTVLALPEVAVLLRAAVPAGGGLRTDGGDGGYGGGYGWWQLAQQVPAQVWLIAAGVLLVLLVAVVLWLRHLWRRSRRRGLLRPERIESSLLALQAQALPDGPARDAAVLRRRLSTELTSTRAAVTAAAATGAPVGGLQAVLGRLDALADTVDGQLRAAQSEPDPGRRAAGLADAGPAAEQVIGGAARIRDALATSRSALDEPALETVRRDIDDEISALTSYTQAYRELGGGA